jgi:hypothetical protein
MRGKCKQDLSRLKRGFEPRKRKESADDGIYRELNPRQSGRRGPVVIQLLPAPVKGKTRGGRRHVQVRTPHYPDGKRTPDDLSSATIGRIAPDVRVA